MNYFELCQLALSRMANRFDKQQYYRIADAVDNKMTRLADWGEYGISAEDVFNAVSTNNYYREHKNFPKRKNQELHLWLYPDGVIAEVGSHSSSADYTLRQVLPKEKPHGLDYDDPDFEDKHRAWSNARHPLRKMSGYTFFMKGTDYGEGGAIRVYILKNGFVSIMQETPANPVQLKVLDKLVHHYNYGFYAEVVDDEGIIEVFDVYPDYRYYMTKKYPAWLKKQQIANEVKTQAMALPQNTEQDIKQQLVDENQDSQVGFESQVGLPTPSSNINSNPVVPKGGSYNIAPFMSTERQDKTGYKPFNQQTIFDPENWSRMQSAKKFTGNTRTAGFRDFGWNHEQLLNAFNSYPELKKEDHLNIPKTIIPGTLRDRTAPSELHLWIFGDGSVFSVDSHNSSAEHVVNTLTGGRPVFDWDSVRHLPQNEMEKEYVKWKQDFDKWYAHPIRQGSRDQLFSNGIAENNGGKGGPIRVFICFGKVSATVFNYPTPQQMATLRKINDQYSEYSRPKITYYSSSQKEPMWENSWDNFNTQVAKDNLSRPGSLTPYLSKNDEEAHDRGFQVHDPENWERKRFSKKKFNAGRSMAPLTALRQGHHAAN